MLKTERKTRCLFVAAAVALSACDGGADENDIIGTWAATKAACATERIVISREGAQRTIAWWRTTDDALGPLPWRSGAWTLNDQTLTMTFDHRVEYDRFLDRRREGPINETAQFDVVNADGESLRLAATTGGFSPEAMFLGGEEKLLVRC